MTQETQTILLRGGLNLVTPGVAMPPGSCIVAKNYEADVNGYRRCDGHERFDGRPRPSEASIWRLYFDAGSTAVVAGNTVTGATSSATGIAVINGVLETGTYGGSDAAGYLVLYNVSGTFQNNENLQVSAATVAVANGVATEGDADNDTDYNTWIQAAMVATRSAIGDPAGSGAIRGVASFGGALYCFRDNAGGTAGVMFKATASGWAAQSLGNYLGFDAGTAAFLEGLVLTGGTSGATGTIRRIVVTSGVWGSTAAGYLVLSGVTGTFQNNETISASTGSATSDGVLTANALPAGGHYDFVVHNFQGDAAAERLYGCNGVGKAFEWDGTYFTPITTGLATALDKPTHIAEFANHLFLGYTTGTVNFSGIGDPLSFFTADGAGTFAFGSSVTGFIQSASSALIICGRGRIHYLTGADAATFIKTELTDSAGAIQWTAQMIDSPLYMDEAGVRRMTTTQATGGWRTGTISQVIQPLLKRKRQAGVTPVASIRAREKDQYRLFFSDGSGISVYFGRKAPELMYFELPFTVSCAWAGPLDGANNEEMLFVGSSSGRVYQLDMGTNFDGSSIEAFLLLAFNSIGTPTQNKVFHKAQLQVADASPNTAIQMVAEYDYGHPDNPPGIEQDFTVTGGGGFWEDFQWDSFVWDAPYTGKAESYLSGFGPNIAIGVLSTLTYERAHVLSAMTLNFMPRGLVR